jgi:antitoxin VapB
MIDLSAETETLARRLAAAEGVSVEDVIRRALEEKTRRGAADKVGRRISVEEMLAVGREIAAMPLLDPRSPQEIMDEINSL